MAFRLQIPIPAKPAPSKINEAGSGFDTGGPPTGADTRLLVQALASPGAWKQIFRSTLLASNVPVPLTVICRFRFDPAVNVPIVPVAAAPLKQVKLPVPSQPALPLSPPACAGPTKLVRKPEAPTAPVGVAEPKVPPLIAKELSEFILA